MSVSLGVDRAGVRRVERGGAIMVDCVFERRSIEWLLNNGVVGVLAKRGERRRGKVDGIWLPRLDDGVPLFSITTVEFTHLSCFAFIFSVSYKINAQSEQTK